MSSLALLLFSKPTNSNKAKTRIQSHPDINKLTVRALHHAFVQDALQLQEHCSHFAEPYIAWDEEPEVPGQSVKEFVQAGSTFPERFQHALSFVREMHTGPLVVIGSDCPLITPCMIQSVYKTLMDGRACLGPAPKGGFYLLGLPGYIALPNFTKCFSKHNEALEVSNVCRNSGLQVELLQFLHDIDTYEEVISLKQYLDLLEALVPNAFIPRNTQSVLQTISID